MDTTPPTPLAPSVEKAYYRKCISLKRRLNTLESSNDEARIRRARLDRSIMKMRLERAFLLDELRRRMDTNIDGSDGSGEEGVGTPPQERPLRDKRRQRPSSGGQGGMQEMGGANGGMEDGRVFYEQQVQMQRQQGHGHATQQQQMQMQQQQQQHGSPYGAPPSGLPGGSGVRGSRVNSMEMGGAEDGRRESGEREREQMQHDGGGGGAFTAVNR